MKKSIRKKINQLVLWSIAMLSVVMVVINLAIINWYTQKDSEIMMENSCYAKALELNDQFKLVEQSVNNIYDISEAIRPSVAELRSFEKAEGYIQAFQELAITIADNTEGAITVYYRLNPDLNVDGTQGFFYVKNPATGVFESHEITNLLEYDVNDMEHVGWYYIPVWAGRPVWMEPYYNANIEVEMISYVVPIYDGINLIGVVGMDIDFDRLIAITENMELYKSSGAVLASMDNSHIYSEKNHVLGKLLSNELYRVFQGADNSEKMLNYKIGGSTYSICYRTLQNRMKLIVYAKKSEIYEQGNMSIFASAIIFAVTVILTLITAMRMIRRITIPIESITEAAKQYAQGNWDAKVGCDTDDELKVLTDNIVLMADNTRQYIDYIQDMAKKDALTGLKNKTAYMLYVDRIKNEYGKDAGRFAIIVFDINNLKPVNDKYGHEKGDELLIAAGKAICDRFVHSPVFRIGGDEFVAILDSQDYEKRTELFEAFKKDMLFAKFSGDEFAVCIASGMAVLGEDGEDYDALFAAADQRMYENKKELKDGKDIR